MPPSKVIAILQPVYLPWLGYFEQMAIADHFVFMDDVQYTRHDWRNRNRIKTAAGSIWLTVPVKKHSRQATMREIEINYSQNWQRKHLRSIDTSYRKCPHFQPLYEQLERALETSPATLVELDCLLIGVLCRFLDISTPTSFSSQVPRGASDQDKNERILEICSHHDATLLYDGAKAAQFIDVPYFERHGIDVVFQDYRHPVYPQAFGEFSLHQSAIDLIMNTGPGAPSILRSSPLPPLLAGSKQQPGSTPQTTCHGR